MRLNYQVRSLNPHSTMLRANVFDVTKLTILRAQFIATAGLIGFVRSYNYIILRPDSISRYIKHHAQYCPQTADGKLSEYQPEKKRHRLSMRISPAVFQQNQFQHPYDPQTKPDVIDCPTPAHGGVRCRMKREPEKLHSH